jgi:hypothetical protein
MVAAVRDHGPYSSEANRLDASPSQPSIHGNPLRTIRDVRKSDWTQALCTADTQAGASALQSSSYGPLVGNRHNLHGDAIPVPYTPPHRVAVEVPAGAGEFSRHVVLNANNMGHTVIPEPGSPRPRSLSPSGRLYNATSRKRSGSPFMPRQRRGASHVATQSNDSNSSPLTGVRADTLQPQSFNSCKAVPSSSDSGSVSCDQLGGYRSTIDFCHTRGRSWGIEGQGLMQVVVALHDDVAEVPLLASFMKVTEEVVLRFVVGVPALLGLLAYISKVNYLLLSVLLLSGSVACTTLKL